MSRLITMGGLTIKLFLSQRPICLYKICSSFCMYKSYMFGKDILHRLAVRTQFSSITTYIHPHPPAAR